MVKTTREIPKEMKIISGPTRDIPKEPKRADAAQTDIEQFTPRDGSIIDDVLRRVLEMKPDFGAALIAQVSKEAHQDWAGDRPYISPNGNTEYKSKRDKRILDDWKSGERLPLLVRRYQISERRIRQIIFGK